MIVKMMTRFLALIMLVGALVGFTAAPSLAHNGTLTGTAFCNDDGKTWGVVVNVAITNTPSDDTAETKAITTTAGTLDRGDGKGVNVGSQVLLNVWAEHAANWPSGQSPLQTRKGNWTDKYVIANIPFTTNTVTTMVQVDWKKWESRDYEKTFTKPTNCKPAQPLDDQEIRQISDEPNCEALTVTSYTQQRTRSYYWINNQW